MMRISCLFAHTPAACLLALLLASGSAAATLYDFQELGPGGRYLSPSGISNSGLIAGSTSDGHGFVLSGGDFRLIDVPGAKATRLAKINGSGTIVVGTYSTDSYGTDFSHAFVADLGGSIHLIDDLPNPGNRTLAWDVNDAGLVVGEFHQPDLIDPARAGSLAFSFADNEATPYAAPGTNYTSLHAVNDRGEMAGVYHDSRDRAHGFTLNGDVFAALPDPAGADGSYPMDVNDLGRLAGFARMGSFFHGWLLEGADYQTLDFPAAASRGDTYITGINDLGQVVGYYSRVTDYNPHAFLATPRSAVAEPGSLCLLASALPFVGHRRKRTQSA